MKTKKALGSNNWNIVFGSTSNRKSKLTGVARGSKKENVKIDIDEDYSEEEDDDEEEYSNKAKFKNISLKIKFFKKNLVLLWYLWYSCYWINETIFLLLF